MTLPLPHILIGGAVVTAVALTYEFVFRKKGHKGDPSALPPPGATATASTALPPAPDPSAQAPAPAPQAAQGPMGPGGSQGYQGGPGGPSPRRRRPPPPILNKLLAGRLGAPGVPRPRLAPGVPAVVGGRPVMSGNPIVDALHLIGFHGYRREDMPVFKRAQTALGVAPDGLIGPHTWAAMGTYAASHRIPMPPIGSFTHWSDGGAAMAASIAAPSAPAHDANV